MIKYELAVLSIVGMTCATTPEDKGFTNLSTRNRYHSLPKPKIYQDPESEFVPMGKAVGRENNPDPLERTIIKWSKPINIFDEGDSKIPLYEIYDELEYSTSSTTGITITVNH
jgi:hypothetical protein